MTLRVWALWGRTRNFGIFLSILSVATIAGGGVAFFKFHSSQSFIAMDDINPVIPGIQRALHSILSARILLRLRQESERTRNVPDAPTEIGPVGQLVFAQSQTSHAEESTGISTEPQASHPRGRPWDLDDGSWFGNGTVSKADGETDYA
ncbi:hypothetical protein PC9H_005502 [Pleurotus ostreatus]|uniref:Uncharacterized protein n=1 Tax=Pleurotus ostreatus TaxID=5322 RepID=A0A8H6ZZ51_PLEOS|nr:uncharacterized protein PC9H_005502 [Pleurotus ostreatus]KAF7433544.1 hypothetical protein PC9H_005502 [Pleurotus ostreatus]